MLVERVLRSTTGLEIGLDSAAEPAKDRKARSGDCLTQLDERDSRRGSRGRRFSPCPGDQWRQGQRRPGYLPQGPRPGPGYFFTDTGAELPETYEYLSSLGAVLGKRIVRHNAERDFDGFLAQDGGDDACMVYHI